MFLAFIKLLLLILGASAIITPISYYLLPKIFVMESMWPYSRVYDRVALVVLIVGLYYYRKEFKLSELKADFALWKENLKWRKFFLGFFIALIPVLLVLPLKVQLGDLSWRVEDFSYYLFRTAKLIPTIFVVSFLEELVFRIFIFWTLYKSFGLLKGVVLSSVFYSFVHFIAPVKTFKVEGYDFWAGFEYYLIVTERILSFEMISALIVLITIGGFLALLLKQTRSLFLCAGFHGGWIAAIKIAKFYTIFKETGVSKLQEQYFLLTFPATWLALATTLFFAYLIFFRKKLWNY